MPVNMKQIPNTFRVWMDPLGTYILALICKNKVCVTQSAHICITYSKSAHICITYILRFRRLIIKNYWMRLSRISELFRPRSALSAEAKLRQITLTEV